MSQKSITVRKAIQRCLEHPIRQRCSAGLLATAPPMCNQGSAGARRCTPATCVLQSPSSGGNVIGHGRAPFAFSGRPINTSSARNGDARTARRYTADACGIGPIL